MRNNLNFEKTASAISYDRDMFRTLKYDDGSSRFSKSYKSNSSASVKDKAGQVIVGMKPQ